MLGAFQGLYVDPRASALASAASAAICWAIAALCGRNQDSMTPGASSRDPVSWFCSGASPAARAHTAAIVCSMIGPYAQPNVLFAQH